MQKYHLLLCLLAGLLASSDLLAPVSAIAAAPNSFILNEANAVSGSNYIKEGGGDASLGRLEGNGQNWLEFLVVQGDDLGGGSFSNTLDLRGWTVEWSYDNDNEGTQTGSGTMTFSNDPLWSAVPRGTMLTISEWQEAWYTPGGPDSGLIRVGGINGLGNARGNPYIEETHTLVDLATDTFWNPGANGGGDDGDWHMHVYAGERNPDTSFKYFSFSGTVLDEGQTYNIGVDDDAGLFAVNNDNWQYRIWSGSPGSSDLIQGPIGEEDTGLGSDWRVGSDEVIKLEVFSETLDPTVADYMSVGIHDYNDGSSSTFGLPNKWSAGTATQDLSGLRDWLKYGDADLDGNVTGLDFNLWLEGAGEGWTHGDFDGDGVIGGTDFNLWLAGNFVIPPEEASSLSAVPEPGAIGLIAVGGGMLACCVRRRQRQHTC